MSIVVNRLYLKSPWRRFVNRVFSRRISRHPLPVKSVKINAPFVNNECHIPEYGVHLFLNAEKGLVSSRADARCKVVAYDLEYKHTVSNRNCHGRPRKH